MYYTIENEVKCYDDSINLATEQPEADKKIALQACNVYETSPENRPIPVNISIRASDCDVLIIMLGNMQKMIVKENTIWMSIPAKTRNVEVVY